MESRHAIVFDNVTYTYPAAETPALSDINLTVQEGEILLITGPTGSGKTTLCSCVNGFVPHFFGGNLKGRILVEGQDTRNTTVGVLSSRVGLLFQDPFSQLVSATVEDEVAFGPENLGLPIEEIRNRVDESLRYVRLDKYRENPPSALSGGQQQACALAAIIAMKPDVYVLDEPTSNLDPIGTSMIFNLIKELAEKEKKTIIIVEHKLAQLVDVVHRVIVLKDGRIAVSGKPREVLGERAEYLDTLGLHPPRLSLLARKLQSYGLKLDTVPLTLDESCEVLSKALKRGPSGASTHSRLNSSAKANTTGDPVIQVRDLTYQYPTGTVALKRVTFDVNKGDFIAIIGQNGSGKTTLAKHFNGLLKPTSGSVTVFGLDVATTPSYSLVARVGYVFQNPNHQLFSTKVSEELVFGCRNMGLSPETTKQRVQEAAKLLEIENYLNERPYSLGQGEKQRVAIAAILAMNPDVLVIDEPTTGQDPRRSREIMDLMDKLHSAGKTIVIITHDMDLVCEYAKRVIVMNDGIILTEGSPREVFAKADILREAFLAQPVVMELFDRLRKDFPMPESVLTVDEAVAVLKDRIGE
jgi:energy-coupling factor transport system ATP-binding protein